MADHGRIERTLSTTPGRGLQLSRRSLFGAGLAAGAGLLAAPSALAGTADAGQRRTRLHRISTPQQWRAGSGSGVKTTGRGLSLGHGTSVRSYDDPRAEGVGAVAYDEGTWTSAWMPNGWGLSGAIASWEAQTPAGTWVEICLRGRTADGTVGQWFVMARWCERDPDQGGAIFRATLDGQGDDSATVWTDTLSLSGITYDALQMRVSLLRRRGTHATPQVRALSVVASDLSGDTPATSTPTLGRAIELDVPTYSQMLHEGRYPQWDNGGQAWCSPTSSTMVLGYWRSGAKAKDLTWVEPGPDPQVVFGARNTYDYEYEGCGNWAFNTAFMSSFGLSSHVHRLRSMADAERYIAAGVPLVISLSFKEEQLDGAGYGTNGHLMVLRGFDAAGDPIVNDPASHMIPSNDEVRVVYRRDQLENRWLTSSGGTVYVAGPRGVVERLAR